MINTIISGGQVVTPWGVGDWDVAIEGEKIVAVAEPGTLSRDVARIIDATGKIVVPGGIEPHAHVASPVPGRPGAETSPPEPVSRAALFGGTTTLTDFAIQQGRHRHLPGDRGTDFPGGAATLTAITPIIACCLERSHSTSLTKCPKPSKVGFPPSRSLPPTYGPQR